METAQAIEGAQTAPQAVSLGEGPQVLSSVLPSSMHAERPLLMPFLNEVSDQDSRRAGGQRKSLPQISQVFLQALARVRLEVGVHPAVWVLRQQGFLTDSRQVQAGQEELLS